VLTIVTCPQCRAPAEITEYFSLPSTDGPVAHMALGCAAGHHFQMPADRLPAHPPALLQAQAPALLRASLAVTRPAVGGG
jgi:hypothetical protein